METVAPGVAEKQPEDKALDRLGELLGHYRWELGPPTLFALMLEGLAITLHDGWPQSWWWIAVTALAMGAGATTATVRRFKPLGHRIYAATVGAASTVWLASAWALSPYRPAVLGALLLLTSAAAGPWVWHLRRRTKIAPASKPVSSVAATGQSVPKEKKARPIAARVASAAVAAVTDRRIVEEAKAEWEAVAPKVGLGGADIIQVWRDAQGRTLLIEKKGITIDQVTTKVADLDSHLGLRPGAVRVTPDLTRACRFYLRIVPNDPLVEPIPWPKRALGSVTDPFALGLFEDRELAMVKVLQQHALVAGISGSGKSGVINALIANLAHCRDVAFVGIDLKGGVELGPWEDLMFRFTTDPAEATDLLRAAKRVIGVRARIARERRWRGGWRPDHENPLLAILVDEASVLDKDGIDLLTNVASLGRALGVQLIVATQHPSHDVLPVKLRSQLETRICLRVGEPGETDIILGRGSARQGWDADRLNAEAPGSFLIQAPGHTVARHARSYLVTDEDVDAIVAARAGQMAVPDSETATAFDEPAAADLTLLTHEDPVEALTTVLRRASYDGLGWREMSDQTGLGRTAIYSHMKMLVLAGKAQDAGRGRWRAVG